MASTVFFAVFAVGYVVQLRLVREVGWRSLIGKIHRGGWGGLGVTVVVIAGSALSARAAVVTAIVLALFAAWADVVRHCRWVSAVPFPPHGRPAGMPSR